MAMSDEQRQDIAKRYFNATNPPVHGSVEETGQSALRRFVAFGAPLAVLLAEEAFVENIAEKLKWSLEVSDEDATEFAQLLYFHSASVLQPEEVMAT